MILWHIEFSHNESIHTVMKRHSNWLIYQIFHVEHRFILRIHEITWIHISNEFAFKKFVEVLWEW